MFAIADEQSSRNPDGETSVMHSPAPILAAFVTPVLAAAGAAAVAAPILIHLLARRRFKRIRWAAMDFLIDAERRNRRRVRLEEWILLALRCLAVFAVGFMLARPFLSAAGLARWAGSHRVERVIVLDDTFSMGYESADGTSFARAKEAFHRILDLIRAETPDDAVTLFRTSSPANPVVSGVYLNESQASDLIARVDALSSTQRSQDLRLVFQSIAESLNRDPGIRNAVLYFASDYQRADWISESTSSTPSPTSVTAPLSEWAAKDRKLRAVLVNVADPSPSNTALTELNWQGGPIVAGANANLQVAAANFAARTAENLDLHVTVGGRPQSSKTIRSLAERQTATVNIEVEFPRVGDEPVRVELPRDALPVDDTRYIAADVTSAIRILVVNGEPSADEPDDEVLLLTTALRPEGPVFSGHEITQTDEAGLEEANLAGFHLVILANVYRPSETAVQALEKFVHDGGGLLIFLGDQVDADLYNGLLYKNGEGLLPAELLTVAAAADPVHLVITDRLHPALRGVSRENDPLGIGQIPFYGYFASKPAGDVGAAAKDGQPPGDEPKGKPRPSANVIATYTDADNNPAILERPYGAGRVLLITTTADKEWNLWPYHPTYLPMMTEFVRHVTRRVDSEIRYIVGAPIEIAIDPSTYEADVLVRSPAYPNEPEAAITATAPPGGDGLIMHWDHTETAGIYQLILRRRAAGEVVQLLAVNVDPKESDLAAIAEPELRRAMGNIPFEYIQGLRNLSRGADDAKTEFWRAALVIAVLTLMSEQFLAWRWGRRR